MIDEVVVVIDEREREREAKGRGGWRESRCIYYFIYRKVRSEEGMVIKCSSEHEPNAAIRKQFPSSFLSFLLFCS